LQQNSSIRDLTTFLSKLKESNIFYKLSDPTGAVMVEVAVPGERWEIEFHDDGQIGVEVFKSTGTVRDANAITELFERFSD
jgi:hypothetical protein